MTNKLSKKKVLFFVLLFLVLLWSTILLVVGPTELVKQIGVENGYLVAAIVFLIGGTSFLTAPSFYVTMAALIVAGLSPLLLGLIAAVSLTIGDTMFYVIGSEGGNAAEGFYKKMIKKVSAWLDNKSKKVVSFVVFLYVGFSPFPNDILIVSLGLVGHPFKQVLKPLFIGNIFFSIIVAYLIANGVANF